MSAFGGRGGGIFQKEEPVMKKSTVFVGLGIALFLLIGIVIIMKLEPDATVNLTPPKEIETVLEISDADTIAVVTKESQLKLNKIADVWVLDGADPEDVSSSKLNALVVNATTYKTDMFLNGSESEYGLDDPQLMVKIKAGEHEHTILVGDKSAVDDVYFASADGKLFSMSQVQYNNLAKDLAYYTDFVRMQIKADDITGFRLEQPDRTIDIYLPDITRLEGNVWYMREPYETLANDTFMDSDVLENLAAISLSDKASELGEERGKLTVRTEDKTYELTIGAQDGGSVMIGYEGKVYSEPAELFGFINADTFEFMNKLVSYVNINDVSAVELQYDGVSHELTVAGDTNDMKFTLNGKKLDSDTGKTLYSALIGITASALYQNEPLGDTVMSVTFKGKDGNDTVVEYKAVNEYTAAAVKNGIAVFVTDLHDLDNLKKTLNNQ